MEIICFHNSNEINGYLSNWYISYFKINNIQFSSMEQYMMYQKAIYFHDYDIASKIMNIDDVSSIKKLGRLVSNYDDNYWNGKRQLVVYEG